MSWYKYLIPFSAGIIAGALASKHSISKNAQKLEQKKMLKVKVVNMNLEFLEKYSKIKLKRQVKSLNLEFIKKEREKKEKLNLRKDENIKDGWYHVKNNYWNSNSKKLRID